MTNVHVHVPEAPFWDRDIYGSAMYNGVPVFSKLGRGPRGFKGEKGDKGESAAGGEDGISPKVEVVYDGGRYVMKVYDRTGLHEYPISIATDPLATADAFTTSDLWPKWYHYRCPNPNGVRPSEVTLSNNVSVHRTYCDSYVRYENGQAITLADDYSNAWNAPLGLSKILDVQFQRNGLDYGYVEGVLLPEWSATNNDFLFTFNFRDDNHRPMLQFVPKLTNQHYIEDCLLSILVAPMNDVELFLPVDEDEEDGD